MSVARPHAAPLPTGDGPPVAEERMQAMRHLARRVAHEMNNLLTPVLGFGELLQGQLRTEPKAEVWLGEICRAAQRAHAYARQLQAFSGRLDLRTAPMDVNDLVRGSLPRLRDLLSERVHVVCRLADGLPAVEADPVWISRSLLAMAEEVGTRQRLEVQTLADPATGRIGLRVADPDPDLDGRGVDAARFFEPYALSDGGGPRAGLAMAAAHGVALQHGGALEVDRGPTGGRRLTVWLPRS